MTVQISNIVLLDGQSGAAVDAELLDSIEEGQLVHWEAEWMPFLYSRIREMHLQGVPKQQWPQSSHWNWRAKQMAAQGLLAKTGFSVMCGGMTEGLMLVDTTRQSLHSLSAGKPLVYVEYLEAAPWNRPNLQKPIRYRGVGSALISAAIELSLQEGFRGRIALHSLPQADGFYRATCGMTDFGPDPTYHNLRYFEMTKDQGEAFLA